ncbi:MAG: DUF885 domain-containing protein [Gammaproteobacteria bacterium]|nr:DUF885 domain-containing protein [Gammaproteobacteria bacterium]
MTISIRIPLKVISVIGGLMLLSGCSSDSSSPPDWQSVTLPETVLFEMDSDQAVLDAAAQQLQGLNFSAFIDQSYALLEQRNPDAVHGANRAGQFNDFPLLLSNISDAFELQTAALCQAILMQLETYDYASLSENEKVDYAVYQRWLNYQVSSADYYLFSFPATSQILGWPNQTNAYFTQVLTLNNNSEFSRYVTLMNQVSTRVGQIQELVAAREQAGIIEPRFTLQLSISFAQSIANAEYHVNPFYSRFATEVNRASGLTAEQKRDYLALAAALVERRIRPAYQALAQQLNSQWSAASTSIGVGQFSAGDAYYQQQLNWFTEETLTAAEIHQLGLEQMALIHQQMRQRFQQLGYPANETIGQLLARAQADGGIVGRNQTVATYEQIIATAYSLLPQAFSAIPVTPVEVIGGPTGGYYIPAAPDGSRPGAFYAQTNQDLYYLTMPTLAYHEAVPGHHLQIALAQELGLSTMRQQVRFTSFVEGWGLYAERLAYDLGWYSNDLFGDIGRLQFEAMRASRLVIDTGIHSMGWTVSEARQYAQQNVGIAGTIERYSMWPGQAVAYTSGMLKLVELRERMQAQLGTDFDLRDFHDLVLNRGAVSLAEIERAVNDYLANAREPQVTATCLSSPPLCHQ